MKKFLLWSLLVYSMLAIALAAHIVMVAHAPPKHLANIQLARIDFDHALEPGTAARLRSVVQGMPGVMHCYVNAGQGTLVYGYELGQQTTDVVFQRVSTESDIGCKPRIVAQADLSGSCPAMLRSGCVAGAVEWIRERVN